LLRKWQKHYKGLLFTAPCTFGCCLSGLFSKVTQGYAAWANKEEYLEIVAAGFLGRMHYLQFNQQHQKLKALKEFSVSPL